jgi:hypothetical protein
MQKRQDRRTRALLTAVALTAAPGAGTAAVGRWVLDVATTSPGGSMTLDDLVIVVTGAVAAVALAWVTVCTAWGAVAAAVVVLGPARPGTGAQALPLRTGLAAAVCALLLATAAAGPASAAVPAPPAHATAPAAVSGDDTATAAVPLPVSPDEATLTPAALTGWTPRVVPPPAATSRLVLGTPHSPSPGHVVVRGDSLWSIAAAHLGPGATAAEIAAEWPRWWQANHASIGDDPDLLVPGRVLMPPA